MLDEANAYESSRDYDCCQIIDGAFTVGCAVNEAYCAGREAKPTDAEVEAVAKKLLWWDTAPAWKDVIPSEDCFWNQAEPEMRANYIRDAREMLEIARKAANE
jgi:hypothetical protein